MPKLIKSKSIKLIKLIKTFIKLYKNPTEAHFSVKLYVFSIPLLVCRIFSTQASNKEKRFSAKYDIRVNSLSK